MAVQKYSRQAVRHFQNARVNLHLRTQLILQAHTILVSVGARRHHIPGDIPGVFMPLAARLRIPHASSAATLSLELWSKLIFNKTWSPVFGLWWLHRH